ncbi:DNA cytosine methyltransferase [Myceligenerans pegani]|uniref:DNA (cytosine-5-)-methyltransferase n=1 Tax=Myceligenerans pegani TaxID=2776917 RepID=A0ABR9N356_9MICO|nr:DNA cytosine methyltransferase [Myceligenerans sp. TRM 65318]MBE1877569.1 DNA cytosine methyltransferase [Myceligenerans sp. TRM 65318]MBE3019840.1 DNA cytosine methyltransferase [Myceligenerans sp. TRM 65318]
MASAPHVPGPIKVLDLFAGCGGLTEGFHQFRPEGMDKTDPPVFRSVGAVEWDPAAAASYAMNFGTLSPRERHFPPTEVYQENIVNWKPKWAPGEIDVVVGGPPCQGFSGLNRNKVGAERNQLWQEFINVVISLQPKVFVIENVDRFIRSPEFADLKNRMGSDGLERYSLREAWDVKPGDSEQVRAKKYLLNAADYGALQARRRAIVIGVRTEEDLRAEEFEYPEPRYSQKLLEHQNLQALEGLDNSERREEPWNTIDDVFEYTRALGLNRINFRREMTFVPEIGMKVEGPFTTKQLHFTRAPEPVSIARYTAIPPGGNRKNLRGRYWCRFDDGEEILLQKDSVFRDAEGKLVLSGSYTEVIDGGVLGVRSCRVKQFDSEPHFLPGRSGRNKSEAYGVVIDDKGRERKATLVYLSTVSWDRHDAGSGDVMGRLRLGRPSVTIRTEFFKPEKGRYLHPTEHRPITHYEAARLQGFPDNFQWCGSKTEIARQIGNAVPIPLGKVVAGAIYDYLRRDGTPPQS